MRKLLFIAFVVCCLPLAATAQTFTTLLTGPNEAPAAFDPDGMGVAVVRIAGTTVHWLIFQREIGPTITGVHIHKAPAGSAAGVFLGFGALNFVDGVASGSITATQAQVDEIKANPAGFYVNVHTSTYPGGAIRGQLEQGCLQTDSTLCVNSNRFRVNAGWSANNQAGIGHSVKLTGDTGYFWFFNQENVEIVLKSLNACTAPFNNHWVFVSGLTNVAVDITVIDTQTGAFKRYKNLAETDFDPQFDTAAFACP